MDLLQDSKNNSNVSHKNNILDMGSLEKILSMEDIPETFITTYFNQQAAGSALSLCRLERNLTDPRLPFFNVHQEKSYRVLNFWDTRNYQNELIRKLRDLVNSETTGTRTEQDDE